MRVLIAVLGITALACPAFSAEPGDRGPQPKLICPTLRTKVGKMVPPVYPKEAKESSIEGKVSLRYIIGKDGSVQSIEVLRGSEPFVQAVKTAVAQWKYAPVTLNGIAVEVDTTVDVIFECP